VPSLDSAKKTIDSEEQLGVDRCAGYALMRITG
jgi:hypothetical protein